MHLFTRLRQIVSTPGGREAILLLLFFVFALAFGLTRQPAPATFVRVLHVDCEKNQLNLLSEYLFVGEGEAQLHASLNGNEEGFTSLIVNDRNRSGSRTFEYKSRDGSSPTGTLKVWFTLNGTPVAEDKVEIIACQP